jgi:hypothetical protein
MRDAPPAHALLVALAICKVSSVLAAPATIGFDTSRLDESGLYGSPDGRRALDYEFCIPDGDGYRQQVSAIDRTARFYPHSRGRIGCGPGQVLTLGSSHQPFFRPVLKALSELPFVSRIDEALFE